ncbi:MAG TPA: indole-3-glycerol phosphate synthase TrpC [Pyrinomonadaceae bacterium]|nr:indole-3-glycerol phosphate synthase TrpC [Pyrinomonadaceae bacterium]
MSRNFLSEIVARKREEIAQRRAKANGLKERAAKARKNIATHRLRAALQATSPAIKIIAEFKRKSPSRGVIRVDLSPADAAAAYERGGASAISVLTDEKFFDGSLDDLIAIQTQTQLPILRKDFLIDPFQIYESANAGADAVLLIAAILDDPLLTQMRMIAEDEVGLDALIEVHDSNELRRAQTAGAKLIGVNNRDLRNFEVSLTTSEHLIAKAPRDAIMVSESGLQTFEQLRRLHELGFHGFLIGESLMQAGDPEAALRELIAG